MNPDMPPPEPESFEFRAEIQQLLHILIHSLYTDREIFLRELLSNASDALNRLQFEMLTQADAVVDPEAELAVRLTLDPEARTLTVSDSGIGMTRLEVIENLGTIARSGAAAFLRALQAGGKGGEIIGQFGVGFYSVFMVADAVEVVTRSFQPDAEAVRWYSKGDARYELGPADKASRGTDVIVHLKEDAAQFAEKWTIEGIVRKHSDFLTFPIYLGEERVNQRVALWRKAPREVEAEAYHEFYQHLTLDPEPPLLHLHLAAEVPVDLHALLFVGSKRERGLFRARQDEGLKLYSRKVLIQEYSKELLPNHLRFVDGVVDSEDLPLNVSRETVQSNSVMAQLRRTLTGRVHKELERLQTEEPERYLQFWGEFGIFLKEGVATDYSARDELAKRLLFHSTGSEGEELTALADYKARMKEGQDTIVYVLGEELRSARRSPHLDPFRARGWEVLLLVEPVDSFLVNSLRTFDGTPLRNADDPALELPPLASEEAERNEEEGSAPEAFGQLVARARALLGERVEDVAESTRLTDSPMRLVATGGSSHEMDRVRRLFGEQQAYEVPQRRLELNRRHPLIRDLADLAGSTEGSGGSAELLDAAIEQLYESALLMEGLHPNPAAMVPRIQQLLAWAARSGARAEGSEGGE